MIETLIEQSISVKESLQNDSQCIESIATLIHACTQCLTNNGTIIFAGNGGSFSDAQHIAAEFVVRFKDERQSLPAIALGCNNSVLTAAGNDYGFDHIFARELSSIGSSGDVFIPISTSGNSPNILQAIHVANEKKLTVIGLTGSAKGAMTTLCRCIEVPSDVTARIQECHILIGHILCESIDSVII